MPCEQLSLKGFIAEMKEVTDGFHPRKFCFVLGAGASRSSRIKSGQELVKIWDRELRERNEAVYRQWRSELGITDENMSSFYSQYYEKRFCRCPADGYNYIEKMMESAVPSAGYVMLAHLLTRTPHNVVVTTNFDHLTEDAVNYYAQNTPLVIGHEALSHYISGLPVRPTIIKIHRDLLFDPKSRSKDLEKLPDSWKRALELIFTNYHPVFIGYAGNDKSLMDFLSENAGKFAHDEWKHPYWMLYKEDKLEGRIQEFLDKSSGLYVFHDGFDNVFIQLGAAFDYVLPKEEDFLRDARDRYKALGDAINAFSDTSKTTDVAEMISGSPEKVLERVLPPAKSAKNESDINKAIEKITSQADQQRMYREATNLIRENEYDEATKILEQLVELDGKNARYHQSLGDAFLYLDKANDALSEYSRVLELEGPSFHIYLDMSFVFMKLKQAQNAVDVLYKALALNPENDNEHFLLGNQFELVSGHFGMDLYENALSEYRKASALNPDYGLYHYCIADILTKLNQDDAAIEEAQKALSLGSNSKRLYRSLSKILRTLGRTQEADQADQKAKELEASEA